MPPKGLDDYHRPTKCSKCGSTNIHYKGLGEYCCGECENLEYDDYGRVRNYLDEHKGTPITVIAQETGVSKWIIRQMVEEERFDICPTSKGTLR